MRLRIHDIESAQAKNGALPILLPLLRNRQGQLWPSIHILFGFGRTFTR